jgi:murein DD-endopeptidase MepM/ murein hydrolase activator NlpD
LRGSSTIPYALCALLLSACARQEPAPVPRAGADIRLPAEIETIESRVPSHATLDGLLRDNQLQEALVVRAVEAARSVFNPRQLRADRPYRLVRTFDGELREFEYQIDTDTFLSIVNRDLKDPEALQAEVLAYDKDVDVVAIDARIDAEHPSLIAAMDAAGENVQLAMALAEIFGGEVDFQSELQPGDSFRVLFEKTSHDGEFAGYGEILGASIDVDHHGHEAFRWQDPSPGGKAGFYDAAGRSLKRFMLRSPLKFEPRVTSGFSLHRLHPIDHVRRPHLGVDYAAPVGAAVVAVAGGTVVSAGYSGASGNLVHLKHPRGIETYYLHLSAFAKGIRAGAHVEQGQVIGRVGATGAATGPHLDYRLKRDGSFVNPLAVHSRQAPGEPIPTAQLAAFREMRDQRLSQLSTTLLASGGEQKPDAVKAQAR